MKNEGSTINDEGLKLMDFPIPSNSFNAVYQLLHIYKHLFEEGIGLRQILDYYFVLKTLQTSLLREASAPLDDFRGEVMTTLRDFGMKRFAGAMMWVLQNVFEAPLNPPQGGRPYIADLRERWPWMLCEPNEKEGKFCWMRS